jgi:hypothetical protein
MTEHRVAVAGTASSQGGRPPHLAEVKAGDLVWAKDAFGELLPRRAITGGINGYDFPVVWVCGEDDYAEALRHSYPPERGDYTAPGMPWPIEDVTPRA